MRGTIIMPVDELNEDEIEYKFERTCKRINGKADTDGEVMQCKFRNSSINMRREMEGVRMTTSDFHSVNITEDIEEFGELGGRFEVWTKSGNNLNMKGCKKCD